MSSGAARGTSCFGSPSGPGITFRAAVDALVRAHETEVSMFVGEISDLRQRIHVAPEQAPDPHCRAGGGGCSKKVSTSSSGSMSVLPRCPSSAATLPSDPRRWPPSPPVVAWTQQGRASGGDGRACAEARGTQMSTWSVGSRVSHHLSRSLEGWSRLVRKSMLNSEPHDNELHGVWDQPESWLRHMQHTHQNVDIWDTASKRPNAFREKAVDFQRFSAVVPGRRSWEDRIVLDPHSPRRILWACIGVVFLLYDLIIIPMQAFEPPPTILFVIVAWFSQLFWTLDIGLSFITGIYVHTKLVRRLRTIAKCYMTSWFPFDVVVVSTMWITIAIDGEESLRAFKAIKLMRFLRLLRLFKFEHILGDALSGVNSPVLLIVFGMVKLMICLILISHVNACLWFFVGRLGPGGWTAEVRGEPIVYQYLVSLHWTLTQFQGTSDVLPGKTIGERAYAVITVILSLLILSTFVSSLTNMMMQLHAMHAERNFQQRALRTYLAAHHISASLSGRVRKYMEWRETVQNEEQIHCEAVRLLPPQLLMDVEYEVCKPVLASHAFFSTFIGIYPRLSRRLAHEVIEHMSLAPDEIIFSSRETSVRMYFVHAGELLYSMCGALHDSSPQVRIRKVEKGRYLSEPSLWMNWQHKGDLVVSGYASLHTIGATEFARLISTHRPAHASCVLYARRYIVGMEMFGWCCTDIINISILMKHKPAKARTIPAGIAAQPQDDPGVSPRMASVVSAVA